MKTRCHSKPDYEEKRFADQNGNHAPVFCSSNLMQHAKPMQAPIGHSPLFYNESRKAKHRKGFFPVLLFLALAAVRSYFFM